jgi:hypothetical protein
MPLATGVSDIHAMNRDVARLILERQPEGAFPEGMVAAFAKSRPAELLAAA